MTKTSAPVKSNLVVINFASATAYTVHSAGCRDLAKIPANRHGGCDMPEGSTVADVVLSWMGDMIDDETPAEFVAENVSEFHFCPCSLA